jgi:hypothetical protein
MEITHDLSPVIITPSVISGGKNVSRRFWVPFKVGKKDLLIISIWKAVVSSEIRHVDSTDIEPGATTDGILRAGGCCCL